MTKNTAIIFLNRLISPVIAMVLVIYVARHLSVEDMGKYSFIRSYFSIFMVIASFGLQRPLIREIANNQKKAGVYFFNSALLGLGSSVAMIGIACAIILLADYPRDVRIGVYIISFALLATTLDEYCQAVFAAFEKFGQNTVIILVSSLLRTAAAILVLVHGHGLFLLIAVILGVDFIELFLKLVAVKKMVGSIPVMVEPQFVKSLVRLVPTFTLISVLSVIYWRVDMLMLSKMTTMVEVGIYAAAYRLMEACKSLPLSITRAMFPGLSQMCCTDMTRAKAKTNQVYKWTALLIIPLAAGTAMFADEIIFFFYKAKFMAAAPVLQILIWTIVPYGLAMILANLLVACNLQKYDLYVNLVAFSLNLVLNFVLIRKYSYLGASYATLISIVVFFALQLYFVRRHLFALHYAALLVRPLVASLAMSGFLYYSTDLPMLVRLIAAVGIYVTALGLMKTFTKPELARLGLAKCDWPMKLFFKKEKVTVRIVE
ncbi:MAG: flippase [Candidatus Zhuqueibacterota bacterium]